MVAVGQSVAALFSFVGQCFVLNAQEPSRSHFCR